MWNEIKDNDDYLFFIELCRSGKIYEFFMDTYGFKSRKLAKKRFMVMMFTSITEPNLLRNKITNRFPSIIKLISCERVNILPALLQRVESYLLIDNIVLPILNDDNNIKLITIHDSIITTIKNKDLIMNKIKDVYMSKFNLLPPLNETFYN